MLSGEVAAQLQDYFVNALLCQPSDIVTFSRAYFAAEQTSNPRQTHAFRSLRYLVGNADEFRNASCTIFCEELTSIGDVEADSINATSLQNILKRLLTLEIELDKKEVNPLSSSFSLLERVVMEQVPTEGSVNFPDFFAYLRFTASAICMRRWLERLFERSAVIIEFKRGQVFDHARLITNLESPSLELRMEGTISTAAWARMLLSSEALSEYKTKFAQTPDSLFSVLINASVAA